MLLKIVLAKVLIAVAGVLVYAGVYDIHITTIEGADKSMSDFQGKKLLIIVLPVTQNVNDVHYLQAVDSLSRKYANNVTVIGVPSYEYGFNTNSLSNLRSYYRGIIGQQVILTQGLYVNKSSGKMQHKLFAWLTNVNQNTHFNEDVKGVGQKFFIDENGELYGYYGPEAGLNDNLLKKMILLQ